MARRRYWLIVAVNTCIGSIILIMANFMVDVIFSEVRGWGYYLTNLAFYILLWFFVSLHDVRRPTRTKS
jgi:uncharacterized membrane protein YhaH (DUF805 family)